MNGQIMKKLAVLTTMLLSACAAALFPACTPGFSSEEFSLEQDIGLCIKGNYVLRYDSDKFQLGYNEDRAEFWITDDNMADYVILKCNSFPENGSTVKADLIYTTENDLIKKSGLSFKVTEYDDRSGKIWLWSQSGRIGVIVKILR